MAFERNEISGYAVIGDPLTHTLSPLIYNTLFKAYELPAWYFAATVPEGGLRSWVGFALGGTMKGFNVTMPHKRAIVPFLDCISDEAAELGAVNTVAVRGGRLFGTSTDGKGFVRALCDEGISLEGKNISVIGAGGVVPSLVQAIDLQRAESVTILSRRVQAGASCVKGLSLPNRLKCDFSEMTEQGLRKACERCDVLINATPLGMHGYAHDFQDFSFLDSLKSGGVLCDLIYRPPVTQLMAEAQKRGIKAVSGLGMLMWQAFFAFEYYCGFLPTAQDKEKVLEALNNPPEWEEQGLK
jgi:shikimate dehydrogenase